MNWLNSRMRRPSGIISEIISSRSSSLLDVSISRADRNFTSRGSQHAWRSFSSASSTTIRLCARLRSATCSRTFSYIVTRIVSYNSRWSGASVIRRRIVCLGGSSVATSLFFLPHDERLDPPHQLHPAQLVAVLLDRRAEPLGETRAGPPAAPASETRTALHSSSRLFSIGVPERQIRCRASSWHTAFVALASGVLIACASSSTMMCQSNAFISRMSRVSTV